MAGSGQSAGAAVADAIGEIERLTDDGDWERLSRVVATLPGLVLEIPEDERRAPVLAAAACIERIRARAERASGEVVSELGTLRAGRRADGRYRAHEKLDTVR